jgi:small subunit ribosomal protein S2
VTDTNCDPTGIEYVVPGNDDALKSITLFLDYFSNAIVEGGSKARKDDGSDANRDLDLETEILAKYEKDIDLQGEEEVEE